MQEKRKITTPFFEIGPKSYLYGDEVLDLALAADAAAEKYGVSIIFTTPVVDIRRIKEATKNIFVFAPHMTPFIPAEDLQILCPNLLLLQEQTELCLTTVKSLLNLMFLKRLLPELRK